MQIIVVSDSHGRIEPMVKIRELYPTADAYLHCGDSETSIEYLDGYASVQGNNDMYYDFPEQRIIQIEDCKILLIHGHQYFLGNRISELAKRAKRLGCEVVCFGHTHTYQTTVVDNVLIVNPGSVYHNRDGSLPSYAIITKSNGKFTVERKEVPIASKGSAAKRWF